MKIFRGEKPATEVTGRGTLFIDGIKYAVIVLTWEIPTLIVFVITIGAGILVMASQSPNEAIGAIMGMPFDFLVVVIIAFLTWPYATTGINRFARTGRMGEVFYFGKF